MDKRELLKVLARNGFSEVIVNAFDRVKRDCFVPKKLRALSYEDIALPIRSGSTISQPFTIAFMLDLLELDKGQKILEIGSGSGYVLALLSEITNGNVFGVEIIQSLVKRSKRVLQNYGDITVFQGDGFFGLKNEAPFDRILMSASVEEFPGEVCEQLSDSGIFVGSVNSSIIKATVSKGQLVFEEFPGFVFVSLKRGS